MSAGLNTLQVISNRCPEKGPEDEVGVAGADEETRRQEILAKRQEGTGRRRGDSGLAAGQNP
jgi:hypothetical protein